MAAYLDYGCCVLPSDDDVGYVHLNLICLDGWTFDLHSTSKDINKWSYFSTPGRKWTSIYIGETDE